MTPAPARPPVLVLMGVSGSGKSTVAGVLHGRLGWPLCEGDDLHPAANIAKMAAGHPLDDDDRRPWLAAVRRWIDERVAAGDPGIVTCSALTRHYRDALRDGHVVFVLLHGSRAQLTARLAVRHDHFMPLSLLHSQLDTLELPGADEQAIRIEIGTSAAVQADQIMQQLQLCRV